VSLRRLSHERGRELRRQRGPAAPPRRRRPSLREARLPRQLPQPPAELLPDEGVQHRVDAAVEQPQTLRAQHGLVHRHPGGALVRHYLGPEEHVRHHREVVRRPAEQEGDDDEHDHPHGAPPLHAAADVQEAPDGHSVTRQHDGQGDQEAQRVAEDSGGQTPHVGTAGVVLLAARRLFGALESRAEKPRQREERADGPHGGADPPADAPPVRLAGFHRSHDHHVAVHADAREEEDARVEAQLLENGDEFAHGVSKHPALGDGGGRERESHGEQEVGDRQVEEVEVGGGQRLLVQADHQPHHQIAGDGHQKDEDVEDAEGNRHRVWDGVGVAGLRLRVQDED